jgi:quinol monooxygenase YgiN
MLDQHQIHFEAEFIIQDGKLAEYKKLVHDMVRLVEANEPDTLSYQFFINDSEMKSIVHEIYSNSEAALSHNSGNASQTLLPSIFRIARIVRFDIYGKPNKELQDVLAGLALPQHTYNLLVGFSRR